MSFCLGIDVGTQSTKALLVQMHASTAEVVGSGSSPTPLLPPTEVGDARQEPESWLIATDAAIRGALRTSGIDAARIEAVGVSGQQHGFVALDRAGEVIAPARLWCDTTTVAEARELSARLGRHIPVGFTASKILAMKSKDPGNFALLHTVLLPHDYLNFRLTGQMCMEPGDASGTGLLDVDAVRFDKTALAAIDERLATCLPPLIESGAPAGRVTAAAAARFGLAEGTLVSSGGGDNMMSAIGSGAVRPGVLVVSLGTSATAFQFSERALRDPAGAIAHFRSSTGGYLPLLCLMNATMVLEEVRTGFAEAGTEKSWSELTRAAASVKAGCDGVRFLPYLHGERVPDLPHASGSIHGLRSGQLRVAVLLRAAMEGVAAVLASGVKRLEALVGPASMVHLVGGGAHNALWSSIIADALGKPVVVLRQTESAALGAALQAHWTARRIADPSLTAEAALSHLIDRGGVNCLPTGEGMAAQAQVRRDVEALTNRLYSGI